jgi:hypothetical protein
MRKRWAALRFGMRHDVDPVVHGRAAVPVAFEDLIAPMRDESGWNDLLT